MRRGKGPHQGVMDTNRRIEKCVEKRKKKGKKGVRKYRSVKKPEVVPHKLLLEIP